MGNRSDRNRKLRAKRGRVKYRLSAKSQNPYYPNASIARDFVRHVTNIRIMLEREREHDHFDGRRIEENEAIALFGGYHKPNTWIAPLSTVTAIARREHPTYAERWKKARAKLCQRELKN
jgi:alpha-D-ribose 1-methylphosphonate 5-phosphate C-P lyase